MLVFIPKNSRQIIGEKRIVRWSFLLGVLMRMTVVIACLVSNLRIATGKFLLATVVAIFLFLYQM